MLGHNARRPAVDKLMEDAYPGAQASAIARARAESLVLEYQVKLARYLRRMVADAEVALDLTQDVFLSAFRMLQADPQGYLSKDFAALMETMAIGAGMKLASEAKPVPTGLES